jgi:hypothetical protein
MNERLEYDVNDIDLDVLGFLEELGFDDEDEIIDFLNLVMNVKEFASIDEVLLEISNGIDEEGDTEEDEDETSSFLNELRRIADE